MPHRQVPFQISPVVGAALMYVVYSFKKKSFQDNSEQTSIYHSPYLKTAWNWELKSEPNEECQARFVYEQGLGLNLRF